MKIKVQTFALLAGGLVSALVFTACASTSKDLDTKMAQEPPVTNRSGIEKNATDIITNATYLTDAQKTQLLALKESARKQMDEIQNDSLKLRAVLVRDVLSANYNSAQVDLIKRRMAKLDRIRMSVIFDTVEKANKVLGREDIRNKQMLLDDLIYVDHQHGDY